METALNLLTREGVVYIAFRPALTRDQYAELYKIVRNCSTAEELQRLIREWARRQRLAVSFDE